MARASKAAFTSYYQTLPDELKALHMFFRAATEYHQTHRPAVSATVQERRWSREELEARAFNRIAPEPVLSRCNKILAADRARRFARARARRQIESGEVLRLNFNAGGGEVVAFPAPKEAALQHAASA